MRLSGQNRIKSDQRILGASNFVVEALLGAGGEFLAEISA